MVSALNAADQRLNVSLGFVFAPNVVATAFQAVDGASVVAITFADGKTVRTDSLIGWSRSTDWALIPVPTESRKPLAHADSKSARIGDRVMAFTVENGNKVAAPVDISGRSQNAIQFNPSLPDVSAGSPVLDSNGGVFGIAGASRAGLRTALALDALSRSMVMQPLVGGLTPIEAVVNPNRPMSFKQLLEAGVLTPPLERFPPMVYAMTTDIPNKKADLPDRSVVEFSKRVRTVWVVSLWARRGSLKNAMVSMRVFDAENRKVGASVPQKVSFGETSTYRLTNSFDVGQLPPGEYRIDLVANDLAVWRGFIRVAD